MPRAGSAALTEAADAMIARHRDIEAAIARRHTEFAALDRDFHLWIIGFLNNRFACDFFDIVSFLFHYHYQWDRNYEVERTRVAIAEHMTVLIALRSGAMDNARHAMAVHHATSRCALTSGLKRGGA
jgi:DNA-binding GntR family transcriptional regulator